jgi:DNA-binding MurR/RpiR family transcriptional regulator
MGDPATKEQPRVSTTIKDRIDGQAAQLTRAERQLADAILENYPVSGLGSITRLAEASGVSTPTVARMVQKLGYAGFPEFQEALRGELEAQLLGPVAKHDTWAGVAPEGHMLNRFTDRVTQNIRQTVAATDPAQFDRAASLLADPARAVYVTGGRITHALSDYFHLHMQVIRPGVRHIRSTQAAWPHDVLDIAGGDVLLVYDIRRYENSTLRLAEMARDRGAEIILITDQWRSPISKTTDLTFPCRIEAPSAWDSTVAMMLLTETLIAAVQELLWDSTRDRMGQLEEIFDRTGTFRKFV